MVLKGVVIFPQETYYYYYYHCGFVMLCFCVCVPTATNEGSVPMSENEEMQILEEDQGDGWTRVRKSDGSEGFVPSSYIQCHYYGQDQV